MPILGLEIVGESSPSTTPPLGHAVADMAGAVLGSRPGGTWGEDQHMPSSPRMPARGARPSWQRVHRDFRN